MLQQGSCRSSQRAVLRPSDLSRLLFCCCFHLVPCKPEGPELWLEVPHHHAVVQGAGYQLLQVAVERHGRDCILVTPERALQGGITRLQAANQATAVSHAAAG